MKNFFNSPEWLILRDIVLERDKHKCTRCKSNINLSVHHIKPRTEGGTNDIRNLITLCNACHNLVEDDATELLIKSKGPIEQRAYYNRKRGAFTKPTSIDNMKLCPGCGRVFEPYRPYQKFCSTECRIKKQGKPYYYKKKPMQEKKCRECGKVFESNNVINVFCSDECRLKYYDGWFVKKKEDERVCEWCGKTFYSAHVFKKYCSHECYLESASARRKNA